MKTSLLINLCLIGALTSCGMDPISTPSDKLSTTIDTEEQSEDPVDDQAEDTSEEDTEDTEEEPDSLVDFSQWGPHYPYGITSETRTASVTDCPDLEYEVYTPYATDPPVVVLGHGFARGPDVMTGWAEHLSSWGIEVLLPTLCHYNVFTGVDHEMNGQNMKELADIHTPMGVVYAGHSAGGLAAIIAASLDSDAIGVLGLDATDTEGVPSVPDFLGRGYADSVACPTFSIMGEPSSCNSSNNGLELFKMMEDYKAIQITSADHCDFENPTDFICELSCESETTEYSDEEIRPVIIALGTAAVMSLHGSFDGSAIWSEEGLSDWISTGIIQEK